jgi:hypothetical protein
MSNPNSNTRLINLQSNTNSYGTSSSINNNGMAAPSAPARKNAPPPTAPVSKDTWLPYKIAGYIIVIGILLFAFGISVASIWLRIKREHVVDNIDYAKGAHLFNVNPGEDSSENKIKMECDYGKVICIENANQICTGSNWTKDNANYQNKNYENPDTDPIASGLNADNDMGPYGTFNSKTTQNVKDTLKTKCGGQQKCDFNYKAVPFPIGMTCSEQTQLIATYTCITKGTECK